MHALTHSANHHCGFGESFWLCS